MKSSSSRYVPFATSISILGLHARINPLIHNQIYYIYNQVYEVISFKICSICNIHNNSQVTCNIHLFITKYYIVNFIKSLRLY